MEGRFEEIKVESIKVESLGTKIWNKIKDMKDGIVYKNTDLAKELGVYPESTIRVGNNNQRLRSWKIRTDSHGIVWGTPKTIQEIRKDNCGRNKS